MGLVGTTHNWTGAAGRRSPWPAAPCYTIQVTRSTALLDTLTRVPLIVMMFMVARAAWLRLGEHIAHLAQTGPAAFALAFGQDAAFCCFALAVCALAVLRLPPVRKARGLLPRAAAMAGSFLLTLLAQLPRATDLPPALGMASLCLLLVGNTLTAFSVLHLGRSFSILPEARRLVTSGPYAVVRHPLYVAEAAAAAGSFLMYLSWPAVALCALQTLFQLARVHYEEAVLRATFPEYADYARRVPRFLPRW